MIIQSAMKAYLASLMAPVLVAVSSAFNQLSIQVSSSLATFTTQLNNKADKTALAYTPNGHLPYDTGAVTAATYTPTFADGQTRLLSIDRASLTINLPVMPSDLTMGIATLIVSTTQSACAITMGAGIQPPIAPPSTIASGEVWKIDLYVFGTGKCYCTFVRLT